MKIVFKFIRASCHFKLEDDSLQNIQLAILLKRFSLQSQHFTTIISKQKMSNTFTQHNGQNNANDTQIKNNKKRQHPIQSQPNISNKQSIKETKKQQDQSNNNQLQVGPNPKKLQKLQYHELLLDNLPSADNYELSYMHRDVVNNILTSSKQNLIITSSIDGHIKFWKKVFCLIEFIKNFKAHNGLVMALSFSKNHDLLVSVGVDRTLKMFDVLNCDLRTVIKLNFSPYDVEFIPQKGFDWELVAVVEQKTGKIIIIDPNYQQKNIIVDDDKEIIATNNNNSNYQQIEDPNHLNAKKNQEQQPQFILNTLSFHKYPIKAIKMDWKHQVCFTIDQRAFVQVWDPYTFDFPTNLNYSCKIQAEFLKLLSLNSIPISMKISPKGKYLAIVLKDRSIRVFNILTGKNVTNIIQSLATIAQTQADTNNILRVQENEYERKMNLQKQLQTSKQTLYNPCVDFDQSEEFLIYTSFYGIKFYSLSSKNVQRTIGLKQHQRFMRIAIYQGEAMRNPSGSSNAQGQRKATDPTIYSTAFKKNRFYIFSRRQPDLTISGHIRDVVNERPNKEQILIQKLKQEATKQREVILQTTMGDIHIELFVDDTPKTCQNFIKLSKKGYYDGLIFHRVIKGFMCQTGCPNGDGTGGQSIWGNYFADQLCPEKHRFEKPYLVAMANRGPNTNGSQFFITVVPCPWLDNKHTIFGRVIKGVSTVIEINKLKTDKGEKPLVPVKIMSSRVLKPSSE